MASSSIAPEPPLPEPPLPDRIRLPFEFDPARLAADAMVAATGSWMRHLVDRNFDGEWSVLPLRHVANPAHPVMTIYADPTATEFEDALALGAMPYVRSVLATFRCPLQTVRLMRLGPGSRIKPHTDVDLAAEAGSARLHVPLVTNRGVCFELNGQRVDMAVGSAWYLRLSDTHSVVNAGDTARIHLVIDCVVNGWLMALLRDAAHTSRPSVTVAGSIG